MDLIFNITTGRRPVQLFSLKFVIASLLLFGPFNLWAQEVVNAKRSEVRTPWDCNVSKGRLSLSLVSVKSKRSPVNPHRGGELDSVFSFVEESSILLVHDREIIIDTLINLLTLEQQDVLTPPLDVDRAMFLLQSLFVLHFKIEDGCYSGDRKWLKNAGDSYANLSALNFTTSSSGSSIVQVGKILSLIPPLLVEPPKIIAKGDQTLDGDGNRDDPEVDTGSIEKDKIASDVLHVTSLQDSNVASLQTSMPVKVTIAVAPTTSVTAISEATTVSSTSVLGLTGVENTKVGSLAQSGGTSRIASGVGDLSPSLPDAVPSRTDVIPLDASANDLPLDASFVVKPLHIFITICMSIILLFAYLLRGWGSDDGKGKIKPKVKTLDPLMTGDMALKSGDFARAAREFTNLVKKGAEGSALVSRDLVNEAEARLCLAYIYLEDFDSLGCLIPKLNCGKIYDRTLVTLVNKLCEARRFILASQLCDQIIKNEIDIPEIKIISEKLQDSMDISNSAAMADAFSQKYSEFHRIHKGKRSVLYRVVCTPSKAETVLKIFDDKLLLEMESNHVLAKEFEEYFRAVAGVASEGGQLSGFGVRPFPHITMDFVPGEPLDLFLKTPGRGDGSRFCSIISKVGMFLIELHKKGVTHGFLETKSIIITDGCSPRIAGYEFSPGLAGQNLKSRQTEDIRSLGMVALQIISGLSHSELQKVDYYAGDIDLLRANISEKLKSEAAGVPVLRLCQFGLDCLSSNGVKKFRSLITSLQSAN